MRRPRNLTCENMYIYIYIYIHTVYIYIYIYIHVYVLYIYIYIHIYVHRCPVQQQTTLCVREESSDPSKHNLCAYIYIYIHTCIYTHTYTYIYNTCICMCMHIHICMYIYIYIERERDMYVLLVSVKKMLLPRRVLVGRQAVKAPDRGEDRSFCCRATGQRLEQKDCFFHRHR